MEENTDMKCEMERLHSQVLSKVLGKEEGRDTTPKKRKRDDGRADFTPKKQKERREYGEKLAALEKARSKVEQARDPREISRILDVLHAQLVQNATLFT